MASRKTLLVAAVMAVVVTAALLPAAESKSTTFTVGDEAGWDIGVDYKAWARGKKFKVGDILVFKPKKATLDVVLVDEPSFNACVSPANASVLSSGGKPASGRISESGNYFFICDAEGACQSGMKLAISVP